MNSQLYEFLLNEIKLKSVNSDKSSNEKHVFECMLCGNNFQATPKSKVQNYKKSGMPGCPKCTSAARYSDVNAKNKARLIEMGYELHEEYTGIKNLLLISNKNCCNRPWKAKVENVLNGQSICRPCNDDKKRSRFDSIREERFQIICKNQNGYKDYKKLVRALTYRNYNENKHLINPKNLPRKLLGKDNGYHLDHIVSIAYCWKHNVPAEVCANPTNLRIIESNVNAKKWSKPIGPIPIIFNKYLPFKFKIKEFQHSVQEKLNHPIQMDYIEEHQSFQIKYKNFLIDLILCEDYKFSILMSKNHLLNTYKECEKLGYRYISIFEYEYDSHREIVLNKLHHILQCSNLPKIYARKCAIKPIDVKTSSTFLEKYHIQGKCNSPIRYGCFYNDELVAVMTFSNGRTMFNKSNDITKFELVRYASNSNYICVGTASKLLSKFKKENNWSSIYSYADKRWSIGTLYEKLGFKLESESKPGYVYVKDGKSYYRYMFAKHKLKDKLEIFDANKTEYDNMLNNGYDKIYDCGQLKFILRKL